MVAQPAQLTVVPSSVVFTAHTNECTEQIDVTAPVGVAEAFTVLQGRTKMYTKGYSVVDSQQFTCSSFLKIKSYDT